LIVGFDGVQSIELINWKGDVEAPAWQSLIESIKRALMPAYIERLLQQMKNELYTERIKAEAIVSRETTIEGQFAEAEQARLEAMARERKAGLELAEATSKLKEVEEKAKQSETDARNTKAKLIEIEASANEVRSLLKESSSKLIESGTSYETTQERQCRHEESHTPLCRRSAAVQRRRCIGAHVGNRAKGSHLGKSSTHSFGMRDTR
jgi:hypothetical protein